MADLFKLFDGTLNAGSGDATAKQTGDSFSGVSSENDLVATLASGSDSVDLLVDYSDFANFVWFNSAESYVTVTADQVLNDYPYGGTADDLQVFLNSLDGFQRYFLELWPSRCGHLRLDPAISSSYVAFTDFGVQNGVSRTSFISPGTGSLSIQGWIDTPDLTGSDDAFVVFQKLKDTTSDGVTVYLSGSSIFFQVASGSATAVASGALTVDPTFFAAVLDRSTQTGSVSLYLATTGTFPSLADSTTIATANRFDLSSGSFYIGSGSLSGKVVRPFTGSLDDVSVWGTARSLTDMTSSFNRKVYAQSGLLASWRFNDATPSTPSSTGKIVRDASGHRLDGRIQSYFSGSRASGSLAYDSPDPILSLDDPDVVTYVVGAQVSGALYDRSNQSLIFNLFPDAFSDGNPAQAEVFKNFVLILARNFDRIKLYISQFPNLRRVSYGDFDQAPDELLDDLGRFLGWDLHGNFASTDALRFFLGRGVQSGPAGNSGLSTQINDIKAQFWRRMLLNLLYVYKTKGTRESVEALLRTYGVDNGFVRLKEYARKAEGRLALNRVTAEKSVYALQFVSGATVSFTGR